MLIEFSVGNYKSFKDITTFSMVAAPLTAKDKTLDENNVFAVDDELKLLKSAVMYGANASGKSNFISAFQLMRSIVLNSSKDTQIDEPIDVTPFLLNTETEKLPSHFEIVFFMDGQYYRYGFEANQERIIAEWLFYVPQTRETRLFERKYEKITVKSILKTEKNLIDRTRNNALFLSVMAQWNGKLAINILQWFRNISIIPDSLDDRLLRQVTLELFDQQEYKEAIIQFVKELDTGIDDIQLTKLPAQFPKLEDVPDEFKPVFEELKKLVSDSEQSHIITYHPQFDSTGQFIKKVQLDMDTHESRGTNKLFSLAGLLQNTIKNKKILIIDELDAHLHPLITKRIVQLFNSNQTNGQNAQLIFTTHDTNLLSREIFRRDQIWFAEKNQVHSTILYSLAEFKIADSKIRNDASFAKDYILGKYGAIPFIGDLTVWGEE